MAQTIKLRRSSTGGNVPDNNDLALGEVAINTNDGLMFIKKDVSGTENICTFHPTTDASTLRTLTLDKDSLATFSIDFPDTNLTGSYIDGNSGRILNNSTGMYIYGYGNLGLYTNGTTTIGGSSCSSVTIDTTSSGYCKLPSRVQFAPDSITNGRTDNPYPTFEMKLEHLEDDVSDMTFSEGIRLSSYAFGVLPKDETTMDNSGGYAYTAITLESSSNVKGLMNGYYARENTSFFLKPYVSSNIHSLKAAGHAEFGLANTVNYAQVIPHADYRGYLGLSNKRWYQVNSYLATTYALTVTGYMLLGDSDQIRFGGSQDAKFFYDGSNNEFELELESACNRFKITDNATTRFTFTKSSGDFTATGNVTAYSDERLKSDIKTLDPSKTLQMRGVEFTKDGKKGSGVIAQELEKIAPELVLNEGDYKSVAYGNLSGYLIETIKDQQKQIDELKELVHKLLEK